MICADFDTFLLAIIPPSPSIYHPNVSWCALPTRNIVLLSITEPTADAVDEMTPNQAHESSPWCGDDTYPLGLGVLKHMPWYGPKLLGAMVDTKHVK